MPLTRAQLAAIYRPVGPKLVQTVLWANGGSASVAQAIDLSLPIRGIRLVFKGRLVIGTAAFTSTNPEGYLNLISNIKITGTNSRQRGNVTLYDIDLPTAWVAPHLVAYRAGQFDLGAAEVPIPTTPFPAVGATGYINGATGTYDFRVVVDLPFHPYEAPAATRPGFLVRNEEWKDSLQIAFTFGQQLGNSTGSLGVAAATTTVTFSSFGSGAGSPTIDIYSLPVVMGLEMKDQVLPGFMTRVQQPIAGLLQSAGNGITLLNMQKQPSARVYAKFGTGTVAPFFATLSDTNVTALGITLGGNRSVRNKVDVFAHKQQVADVYDRDPIQGYNLLDFIESGNPDSAYPGDDIGEGASFQLVADVVGVANAYGIIVQEQMLYAPSGPLYNF